MESQLLGLSADVSRSENFKASKISNFLAGLEDPNSEFLKHGRRIFDITKLDILRFIGFSLFPKLCRMFHLRLQPAEATDFFFHTFLKTMEYREKNNIERNDLVSLLLTLKGIFTKEELAAESFLMYIAGFETSSTLLTFMMYELALHPVFQDRLRSEILRGLEDNDGKLTYEVLFGFKYLDMVMNETLRKYPPIPNQERVSTKDYKIPRTELIIPEGTRIEIVTFSIHRDPDYYLDPEKFDPERFAPENVKARNPLTFMPFGKSRNFLIERFLRLILLM